MSHGYRTPLLLKFWNTYSGKSIENGVFVNNSLKWTDFFTWLYKEIPGTNDFKAMMGGVD